MKQVTNITSDPQQRHILEVEEKSVILTLIFHPVTEMWTFNVEYNDFKKYGFKLSISVLHLANYNWPFDIVIIDTDNSGIDPFKIDDFESGRIELLVVSPEELEELRGYSVQI
jgi:hypothetical protein